MENQIWLLITLDFIRLVIIIITMYHVLMKPIEKKLDEILKKLNDNEK
ncbi:MAG: hypothetical protein J1F28_00515 [Oscillospiraceae bacterium]|nr:hypothetical protein [Oscillospiraceae bacterium]